MFARAVWLSGTVGVGKTTVGEALTEHLAEAGDAVAFINTDDLGRSWPRPPEDPFNVGMIERNMAALAHNFVASGAQTIVVAGVIQTVDQLGRFSGALGATPRLVRIVASSDEIERRLRRRHGDLDASGLRWHLERAPELDDILDRSGLPMTIVENRDSPLVTAEAVLVALGWAAPGDD